MVKQTRKEVEIMKKAGYPLCLTSRQWEGKYPRHCDACIRYYKREKEFFENRSHNAIKNND